MSHESGLYGSSDYLFPPLTSLEPYRESTFLTSALFLFILLKCFDCLIDLYRSRKDLQPQGGPHAG